jgi:membrane protein required for colicin V production
MFPVQTRCYKWGRGVSSWGFGRVMNALKVIDPSIRLAMNVLDYTLIGVVGYCLGRGLFRGLVKELSSIIGVLGGFYAAYTYYPLLAKSLAGKITNSGYLNIFSFLLLFTGVYVSVSLAGVVIKHLMNIAFLGWTDRVCGAFFGFLKGALIIAIMVLMLTAFLPKNAMILKRSVVTQYTMQFSSIFVNVVPGDMKKSFQAKMKALRKAWRVR